jgi:hypothetical protein
MENQGLKTTQRGGIMRHFQTRYIHKQHFKLLVYRCFRRASTTRGRHSHEAHQAPQTPFHKARFRKTANCILEERCENSPQKRAKDNPPKAAKSRTKSTFKKGSQNGSKTTLEIQKVPQNKQITKPAKAKKGSKMDLKNGTKNAPKNPA